MDLKDQKKSSIGLLNSEAQALDSGDIQSILENTVGWASNVGKIRDSLRKALDLSLKGKLANEFHLTLLRDGVEKWRNKKLEGIKVESYITPDELSTLLNIFAANLTAENEAALRVFAWRKSREKELVSLTKRRPGFELGSTETEIAVQFRQYFPEIANNLDLAIEELLHAERECKIAKANWDGALAIMSWFAQREIDKEHEDQ